MSMLERYLKARSLNKLAELCEIAELHSFTRLTLAYVGNSTDQADELLARVRWELEAVLRDRGES